jgi:hypothetical protein
MNRRNGLSGIVEWQNALTEHWCGYADDPLYRPYGSIVSHHLSCVPTTADGWAVVPNSSSKPDRLTSVSKGQARCSVIFQLDGMTPDGGTSNLSKVGLRYSGSGSARNDVFQCRQITGTHTDMEPEPPKYNGCT